ncbi:hypothetical protein HAP95_15630 [Acidithiobacillus sp. RW2]|uniref:DUF308 domain-containing protein n=1 Tax=Acidithiobacillus sulfurivorans TaxID=1958756 RepID=A0ABS6A2G8_9PROT|nr:hypothetical protein [Acidithiobacillus sulfurivorans]
MAIRGAAALVYALVALADFKATIPLLVWFFAIYVLFDGAYALRVAIGQQIDKELVLIIGSGAYLALAVALQFLFALAPQAGSSIYNWIIIGFSAAFGLGMLIMSWAMRKNQFG